MSQLDTQTETLRARAHSGSAITDLRVTAHEGADAFAEVADGFGDALDESIRR
jgi:hypothetical protein